MTRLAYIIIVLIQVAIFVVVKDDPFFGDAISSTVRAALHIYENGLGTIFYPVEHDPAHPTLYAWLLAACWTLFGKTLWVAHLYSCIWSCLLGFITLKIASALIKQQYLWLIALLICLFPTYLSQSAMMLNTVALMSFVLIAFDGFIHNNKNQQLIGMSVMMLLHTQATFFLLGFAIAHFLIQVRHEKQPVGQWFRQNLIVFAIPFFIYGSWLLLHIQHTGWAVQSPNYTDTDQVNNLSAFFKSMLVITWRLVDYGMLPVYLLILYCILQKQLLSKPFRYASLLLLVNSLLMSVFLENTIGHRYFLVFQLLALVFAVSVIQNMRTRQKPMMIAVVSVSLVAGNFLYYPGKTLGDATLAYRSYFDIEKQITQQFGDTFICYSYAPIANPRALSHLQPKDFSIKRIEQNDLSQYPAVLLSNVNAEFNSEQKQLLSTWPGHSFEKGAVYANLYFNPNYYQPNPNWKLRQPGWFELWFNQVKTKIKK